MPYGPGDKPMMLQSETERYARDGVDFEVPDPAPARLGKLTNARLKQIVGYGWTILSAEKDIGSAKGDEAEDRANRAINRATRALSRLDLKAVHVSRNYIRILRVGAPAPTFDDLRRE